jgi:hypothetical protein
MIESSHRDKLKKNIVGNNQNLLTLGNTYQPYFLYLYFSCLDNIFTIDSHTEFN